MKICFAALALGLAVLSCGGCAYRRPCPPGTHLGPAGLACRLN